MPLRSVEAASRDDAIAAAREQFGPQARVVGVRRVRSGGVLGFFATERYVAEVAEFAPETTVGPAVPSRSLDDDLPADFSSPLASAAPARARAAAPARNGAAAWAAAARSTDDIPDEVRAAAAAARAARSSMPARAATPAPAPITAAAPAPRPAVPARSGSQAFPSPVRPADDDRVSELVGLLGAQRSESAAPAYSRATFPRASSSRTGSVSRPAAPLPDEEERAPVRGGDQNVVRAAAPATPSPFTAALARMVAGDQDVRQAVQDALAGPAEERPRHDAEPWPVRAEPVRTAETAVPPVARQEEETVGDQVIAPPSTTDRPVEVPTWAATPEVVAASVSPREEAIADLLRGALAQGHSDEALAGILRKVLAGASPLTALAGPATEPAAATVEPVFAVPSFPVVVPPAEDVPVVDLPPRAVPVLDLPPREAAVLDLAARGTPTLDLPAAVESVDPVPAVPVTEAPFTPPVVLSPSAGSMWGLPASTSLWGEAVPAAGPRTEKADAPSWAEVTGDEPAPRMTTEIATETAAPAVIEPPAVQEPVAETPSAETPVLESSEAEAPRAEATTADVDEAVDGHAVDQAAEEFFAEDIEETGVVELAPVLARTASDPAPMMSLDATTVMPPLTLLPPLPSSQGRGRGRGRPPVPPAMPRSTPSSSVPTPAAPAEESDPLLLDGAVDETGTPAVETPTNVRAASPLATVTRLPVAPLMAGPETPELADDLDEVDTSDLFAPVTATLDTPAAAPAVLPSGDVAARLELLGLPAELLGSTFAADVAEQGTYAALTRTLALQLPAAPELPRGAGDAVFVVGPGADALRAARSLAASLHLDPECVQWATRGDLAGLAPRTSRITSVDAAIDRRQESLGTGTVTIVAVDAPLRADAYWMAQMVRVWAPVAVWAVAEATRKPEDLEQWIDGLPRVDALIVQDIDLSADPAAVLRRVDVPVALLDGVRATPHRWASLLCERLESTTT